MVISVVIPTYNRYTFLKRALTSVFTQTYKPSEVIVIDDGSTDNTSQIKQDFPSIRYFYQQNKGVSSARNLGIKKASYEWIAFLDSDDEWHKDKLKEQVAFHKQNPDILMSYTDEVWIRNGVEVKIPKKFKKLGVDIFKENLEYCNIAPSSVCLHVELLKDVGLFDESLEVCEDYDLWLRILVKYRVGLIDKKLIKKYAGHEDQLSFKHWGMDRFRVESLEKLLGDFGEGKPSHPSDFGEGKLSHLSGFGKGKLSHPSDFGEGKLSHSSDFGEGKLLYSGDFGESKSSYLVDESCMESVACLRQNNNNKQIILFLKKTIIKKYKLLLKGAIKYDKIQDIKNYEDKLKLYE